MSLDSRGSMQEKDLLFNLSMFEIVEILNKW